MKANISALNILNTQELLHLTGGDKIFKVKKKDGTTEEVSQEVYKLINTGSAH